MAHMDDDFKQDLIDVMSGVLPTMLRKELKPALREELKPILHEELKPILREELRPILKEELKPVLREELRPILRDELRPILREEMEPIFTEKLIPIHQELALIRQVQGAQGTRLNAIYSTVGIMKHSLRGHSHELTRLNVLMEDYNDRLAGIGELHSS